ncbi:hypothetical protein SAMD00023353_2201010 [Rosellinia necatrix]|uniref:Uncharacterized protein n=1 Tax=Rosellinia necatrix TaxID=77044 RepID=A0A1S8A8U8_ROSNE|nr:hypothetical protein SAMD00023353_2201010 [Rosellinia necatrix]
MGMESSVALPALLQQVFGSNKGHLMRAHIDSFISRIATQHDTDINQPNDRSLA